MYDDNYIVRTIACGGHMAAGQWSRQCAATWSLPWVIWPLDSPIFWSPGQSASMDPYLTPILVTPQHDSQPHTA